MAVLWGHVNDPVPDASERNPSLPGAVDSVLRKALAKDPGARYSSCRALVADLREALGLHAGRERSRRRLLAAGVLAVLLAAGATAAGLVLGSRGGSSPPSAGGGALVRVDASTGHAGAPVAVGADPVAVAATPTTIWVASRGDGALWRYSGSGISTRIPSVGVPGDLALAGATLYVAAEGPTAFSGNVAAYDARSGQRLGGTELLACSLAAGREGVWVAGCPNVQQLTETAPLRILHTVPIAFQSPLHVANARQELSDMTVGGGFVYVLGDAADRRLWRIDPRAARVVQVYKLDFVPVHVGRRPGRNLGHGPGRGRSRQARSRRPGRRPDPRAAGRVGCRRRRRFRLGRELSRPLGQRDRPGHESHRPVDSRAGRARAT